MSFFPDTPVTFLGIFCSAIFHHYYANVHTVVFKSNTASFLIFKVPQFRSINTGPTFMVSMMTIHVFDTAPAAENRSGIQHLLYRYLHLIAHIRWRSHRWKLEMKNIYSWLLKLWQAQSKPCCFVWRMPNVSSCLIGWWGSKITVTWNLFFIHWSICSFKSVAVIPSVNPPSPIMYCMNLSFQSSQRNA